MADTPAWLSEYPEVQNDSWLNQYKEVGETPFLDLSETASSLGRAVTSLPTTTMASLSQAWEGLENPWKRSEGYLSRRQEMQALQDELAASGAEAAASGDASTVSSAIRAATPSLGFSFSTLGPSIAAGAGTLALSKSPAAARGAATATSALMAYRMAGAQFLDDAKERIDAYFQENVGRAPNEQEQAEAYQELLPLARKFGAAEAGPEALGNLALGGAGKYIRRALGGKGGIVDLASNAFGKVTGTKAALAGAGALASEVGTEAVTGVEQSRIQKQFEEGIMRGESPESVALADRSLGDYASAIEEVAPATIATVGMMGAAGLGPKAISSGIQALRGPKTQAEQPAEEQPSMPLPDEIVIAEENLKATENVPFTDVSGQAVAATIEQNNQIASQPAIQPKQAAEEAGAEVTPSPEMEMPKKSSQTITGSNGEIAPEMPVQPTAGEAPLSEGAEPTLAITPEEESLAAKRRADLLSSAAAVSKGKAKAQVSPAVTAMVTPQPAITQENATSPEIIQESVREKPQDRIESREVGEASPSDQLRGAKEGEVQEEVITSALPSGRHRFSKLKLSKLPKQVVDSLMQRKTSLDNSFNFTRAPSIDIDEDSYYTLVNPATGESRRLTTPGEFAGTATGKNVVKPTANIPLPKGAFVVYQKKTPGGGMSLGVVEGSFEPQKPAITPSVALEETPSQTTKAAAETQPPESVGRGLGGSRDVQSEPSEGSIPEVANVSTETETPSTEKSPATEQQYPTKEEMLTEPSEVTLSIAKRFGGRIAWSQGDLAIIEAFQLFGSKSLYIAVVGDRYSMTDFTLMKPEQRKTLLGNNEELFIRKREEIIEANNRMLAQNPDGPFTDGQTVVVSKNVPQNVASVFREWVRLLGLTAPTRIVLTTPKDGIDMASKYGGKFRRIGVTSLMSDNERGQMTPLGEDDFHIFYKEDTSYARTLEVLAHELGHVLERQAFKNLPEDQRKAIIAEHEKWLKRVGSQKALDGIRELRAMRVGRIQPNVDRADERFDELNSYWKSFSEWFADQVARWATTTDKPITVIEKFFARLGKKLREFFNLKGGLFAPNQRVAEWLDSLSPDLNSVVEATLAPVLDKTSPIEKSPVSEAAMSYLMDDLTDAQKAKWTPEMFAAAQAYFDGGGKDFESLQKVVKHPSVVAQAYLKADKAAAAEQDRIEKAGRALDAEILRAEREEKKAEAEMLRREEMRSKAIDSIIGASEKKKRKFGQVTNSDAIAAVAMLVSSKDIPGVLTTWWGMKEDFLRDPANRIADQEIYDRIKAGEPVEGFFNKGRAYVFLDGIGVSENDMLRGEQMDVSPQIAAVRRVLLHESLVHRGIHGLPLRHRRKILNWVRQNSTPEQLDDLAKLYTEYSNWRNSEYQFEALAEEFLAKQVDSLTELPKDGPMAKLMDILRQIWDFIVGYKREPTLSDLKSVIKLLKSGAEALANDRLKDGGEVKLSMIAPTAGITPEMDAEYLAAVEAGDMEKAQRMVDEAAKATGREKFYHTGPAGITEFKARRGRGSLPDSMESGIYLEETGFIHVSPSPNIIGRFNLQSLGSGEVEYPLYVNLGTVWDSGNLAHRKRLAATLEDIDEADLKGELIELLETRQWRAWRPNENEAFIRVANVSEALQLLGFDSVKLTDDNFAVLSPNQLKSADPVTYDDAGNVIPLSQRFQPTSPDIRFSRPQFSSETSAALSAGSESARSSIYSERDMDIREAIRRAYEAMPKTNSVAVPIGELFAKTEELIPGVTQEEFSLVLQDLFEDNGAVLQEGGVVEPLTEKDRRYLALAQDEDANREELQRMVDEAAKAAGYNIGPVWHHGGFDAAQDAIPRVGDEGMHFGTKQAATERAYGKQVDDFIREAEITFDDDLEAWFWSSQGLDSYDVVGEDGFRSEEEARSSMENFATSGEEQASAEELGTFTTAFLKADNLISVDDQKDSWHKAVAKAKSSGANSIRYKNLFEDKGSISYIVFSPEQIKSADPVTYDDAGNVIPLSRRFDTGEDIRGQINVTTPEGKRAGFVVVMPRAAKASRIKAEGTAVSKLQEDVRNIDEGSVKADFEGRQFTDTKPNQRTVKPKQSYTDAAVEFVDSLQSEGNSLEDIAYSIQSPEFIEGLGIERDLSMQDAIGLEVRNRINNALRKEKAPSVKARLNKLNLSLSKFWQGIGSMKGQHLAIRQKLIADPRYRWMFIKDKAEEAMKEARENVATANITSTDDLTNQMNREGEKASEQAGQSVADEAASMVEEDEDATLIREGEETLDERSKSLWERAKMLIMRLAMYARADKADIKTGSKASLSKEQRDELNAILRMPKAERDKARAKDEAELKTVLKALLGEEVDAKTPEQKKIRGKRIKGIQTLEKRVKKGKPVDVEIEGETESSEEQVSKAEKTAQSILKGLSERYSDPLIIKEKKPNVDAMRELYKERVKQGVGPNQMTEESFVSKAVELGADEKTAGILWKAAELEIDAREAMRQDKILQRKAAVGARADAQAHRIIFAKERLKRQSGFSGIESNANKDTIIKAFQEQVKTPVSIDNFIARLRPLNVSETVAKRLFTAAEREKADLEAMEAFRMLEGPDALKNILREIERMRRGEEIPLRTPIPWRQLLSQKAKTVEEYRQRIFDAISANEAFQNLSDDKKAKLADLFSEAWESKRKDILERMLTNLINKEEAAKRISKDGAKALREQSRRLVEDINLGILDSDELMKRLAEKFGIKSEFTEEEKQKIDSLIDTLQDSTLNRVKRNKAAYDLLKTLSGTVKVPITKLLADLWVTNVLSGINTMTSIALAVSSGAFELTSGVLRIIKAAIANQKELPAEISASFKSLARFLGAFPREANLAWQYLVTGDRAFLDPSMNDVLNDLNYDSIGKSVSLAERLAESDKLLEKTVGVWMRTVSRLLTALDSFNSGVTKSGAIPIVARQLELDPATLAKAEESMNLQNYKDRIIQRDFAGVAPKTAREKALLDSWAKDEMMADLDKYGEFTENADFFGQQGAMTLEPSGIGGMIYRLIKSVTGNLSAGSDRFLAESQRKWQESGKTDSVDSTRLALAYALQFIAYNSANLAGLRFARFAGNKFNQGLSFIPGIGTLRIFEADLDKTHVKGKESFMDMIQRNQFAGVMMSVVGLAILKAIADEPDDEKRGWSFNGGWANLTPERKQQKLAAGEKEYTITIGDKVFNYQNWPISSVLAAIGGLSDLIRYSPEQWNEKSIAGRLGSAAASGVFAASDIPALSQFQELFGSNLSSKDPNEKKLDRAARVLAGWGGGFVPRILKDFDYLAEPTIKKYDTLWERTASHIPVYRRYVGDDYYDILGKPIERKIYPGSREFMEKPSAPEYQILGKLNSRGIWLTPANAEHRMVGKGRNRRRLTQEEADAYSLETGKGYRQMLLRYGQRALQMPTERARAFLSDKADEVRDRALKKVYRGYK